MAFRLANWNISRKGLALLLMPLALSLVFLGTLRFLLHESELQTAREKRDREIHATTNGLGRCFFQAVSTVSTLLFLRNEALVAHFQKLKSENDSLIKQLTGLVKENPRETAAVSRFAATDSRAFELLETLMEAAADGDANTFLHIQGVKSELESATNDVLTDMTAITRTVQEEEAKRQEVSADSWKSLLEWSVYFGTGASIGVTLLLARLFGREISDRLKVIVVNTQRLTSKQELLPPLRGQDEIAALDHTFHDMARSLSQAEQMKREFVAMLTHDLRNPLTAISLALSSLEDKIVPEKGQQTLVNAQRDVYRLLHMINDLLDLERFDAGKMPLNKEVTVFASVMDRAVDSVLPLALGKQITIEKHLQGDCEAFADAERLIRVLVNLLSNAIKYTPDGGRISVTCTENDAEVRIAVCDSGPGLSEEQQNVVFEKYRQLEDSASQSGSGLGLAICQAIVQSHNGKIGVESQSGRGSTFWFTIPAEVDLNSGGKESIGQDFSH